MKTYSAKPLELERTWWLIDAEGQTVGRLASLIANLLRGKHKPQFTPNVDSGDFVVVINADKVRFSGKKLTGGLNKGAKLYHRHSHYPGGMRIVTARDMLDNRPEKVLEIAVKGMLPHNTLGRQQFTKMKVYAGVDHPHAAQQPVSYQFVKEGAR